MTGRAQGKGSPPACGCSAALWRGLRRCFAGLPPLLRHGRGAEGLPPPPSAGREGQGAQRPAWPRSGCHSGVSVSCRTRRRWPTVPGRAGKRCQRKRFQEGRGMRYAFALSCSCLCMIFSTRTHRSMVKAQNTGNASCRFRLRRSDLPPRNARFLVAKESVFSAQDAALPCAGRTFSQCVLPRPLRAALFHARSSGVRRNALFQRSGRAARAAQAECTSAVRVTEAYMSRPLYSVSREKHLCAARRWHGYVFALHRLQSVMPSRRAGEGGGAWQA